MLEEHHTHWWGRMSVLPKLMLACSRMWWYWRQGLWRQLGFDEALGMEPLNGICVWEHGNKVCFRKQEARPLNVPGPGSRALHTIVTVNVSSLSLGYGVLFCVHVETRFQASVSLLMMLATVGLPNWLNWLTRAPEICLYLSIQGGDFKYRCVSPYLAFPLSSGDQIQVLMFAFQGLCPLSPLSSLISSTLRYTCSKQSWPLLVCIVKLVAIR